MQTIEGAIRTSGRFFQFSLCVRTCTRKHALCKDMVQYTLEGKNNRELKVIKVH
jgi:hypothetical protein